MEEILDIYALPYNPEIPLICMDEQPVQLLGDRYEAIEMKPGRPAKEDYQYTRNGTCSIFMFTEPLGGWCHASAKEHRTKYDWATEIRELLEVHYPNVSKIRMVRKTGFCSRKSEAHGHRIFCRRSRAIRT
jgi:hypothetical protein